MLDWIAENLANIIISTVLVVIVLSILRQQIKNRRAGRGSCGSGCSGCAMKDSCRPKP